jgi:hypothetical protein
MLSESYSWAGQNGGSQFKNVLSKFRNFDYVPDCLELLFYIQTNYWKADVQVRLGTSSQRAFYSPRARLTKP